MRPDPAQNAQSTILVVDDSEDNRVVLRRYLERAGYAVQEASGGVEALAKVGGARPDLILLDWMMPELSGPEVLSSLRERFNATELPIIMCTARDEASSITSVLNQGANDFVTKPISREVVLARVKAQLERKAALDLLAVMNRDLGQALAERTRSLLATRADETGNSDALNEILRLVEWLQTDRQADDSALRSMCAASIASAARRLTAA